MIVTNINVHNLVMDVRLLNGKEWKGCDITSQTNDNLLSFVIAEGCILSVPMSQVEYFILREPEIASPVV